MYDDRTEEEYHENRNENFNEPDPEYRYITGIIGEVDFDGYEPLVDADEERVREYIIDMAEEELRQMYIDSMEYEDFKELEQTGDFDEYFMDWVKEEVGYAYDDPKEKAFGLLEVEHD